MPHTLGARERDGIRLAAEGRQHGAAGIDDVPPSGRGKAAWRRQRKVEQRGEVDLALQSVAVKKRRGRDG
jgi:hypothetical protein